MKKKIFMITLAACLLVLSVAGTSFAYFTDTEAKSTVFTAGNVYVALTYNYDMPTDNFFPGQTYEGINASIENVGTEDAYVGAIIKLSKTGLNTILTEAGEADNIPAKIATVFKNLDANTVKYVVTADTCTIYVVVEAAKAKNATADIFTSVAIPAAWGNEQMATFNGMEVTVTAYATQTVGFNNATQALTTAFADWAGYPN